MTVLQMVRNALEAGGYDGLYNDHGECGCPKDDLSPGDCLTEECEAAYLHECPGCRGALFGPDKALAPDAQCPECAE